MYRLVTDNSLEKKIYDRQINKQGMSDRIVDELNPDAHLSSKEVHSLICDEEEDPDPVDMQPDLENHSDPVMQGILGRHAGKLTRPPFTHESLLVDRKDNKLSRAEKKLAERAYKLEKTSKITYSRPSYAAFYPKQGTFATNLHNPGSNGFTRNRYYENGKRLDSWISPYTPNPISKPIASVRPLQAEPDTDGPAASRSPPPGPQYTMNPQRFSLGESPDTMVDSAFPTPTFSNVLSTPESVKSNPVPSEWNQRTGADSESPVIHRRGAADSSVPPSTTHSALQALSRQGVGIQQVTVPRDLVIPTNANEAPISLKAGDTVMVIRTPKGIYLRLEEKIIKIKQQGAVQGLLGSLATINDSRSDSSDFEAING